MPPCQLHLWLTLNLWCSPTFTSMKTVPLWRLPLYNSSYGPSSRCCGAHLLITLWLIIVRAHPQISRKSVVFILTAESEVVIGSHKASRVSISRAHLRLQTPAVLLLPLQSWTATITFLRCSFLICIRKIKVWVNLYNTLRMFLLKHW